METLGYRLKKARERKRFSQVEVYKRIGINNKSLSRYEADGTEPDADTLRKLSGLYGVSVDWILGKDEKESVNPLPDSEIDSMVKRIEKEVGVSIGDDPIILEGIERTLRTYAQIKKNNSESS